jgi:hypothetical protein
MHDVEIREERDVIPWVRILDGGIAAHILKDGKDNKAYKNAQIIQGPDAKYPPHIEFTDVNGARDLLFLDQQVGNEETAEHKEEIDS